VRTTGNPFGATEEEDRPGLFERFANRAEVSTERMGANLLDLGGKAVSLVSPAGKGISETAESIRKYAKKREAEVPEAEGVLENIASGAGYILPDIAATLAGGGVLRGLGLVGKASQATGLAGAATRAAQGAAAAAPLTTIPRALVGEEGESPTQMLTGTTNPLYKLAGDVGIDVLGGVGADLLFTGAGKAGAKLLRKAPEAAPVAVDNVAKEVVTPASIVQGIVTPPPAKVSALGQLDETVARPKREPEFTGPQEKTIADATPRVEEPTRVPSANEEPPLVERVEQDVLESGAEPPDEFRDMAWEALEKFRSTPMKEIAKDSKKRINVSKVSDAELEDILNDRVMRVKELETIVALWEERTGLLTESWDRSARSPYLTPAMRARATREASVKSGVTGRVMETAAEKRATERGISDANLRQLEEYGFADRDDFLDQKKVVDRARLALNSLRKSEYLAATEYVRRFNDRVLAGDIEGELLAAPVNPVKSKTPKGIPSGSARPTVVNALGGFGAGATVGVATDEEGGMSPLQRALLYGAAGAVAGAGSGALLSGTRPARLLGQATTPPASTEAAASSPSLASWKDQLAKTTAGLKRKPAAFAGPVDAADYINAKNFSSDPNVQKRLLDATDQVVREYNTELRAPSNMTVNGKSFKKGDILNRESFDEVRAAAAADLGVDPSQLATRTANGERIGRVDMLRVKTAIDSALNDENELLTRLANPASYSKEEIDTMQFVLGRVQNERSVLTDTFIKQGTQTARDLNAMKIGALKSGDPSVWIIRLQRLAGRSLTDAEVTAARNAGEAKDIDALMQLAQEVRKNTWQEKVSTWIRAGMLTSPKTHLANILGNTTMQGLESAKDLPAAVFDRLLSIKTGIRTKDFDATASARASLEGAINSRQAIVNALKGKKDISAGLDGIRETQYDNAIANLLTKGVFRSLGAADEFFKSVSFARSVDEQARVLAKAEKRSGEDLVRRIAELKAAPTDEMAMRAGADAAIATFQDNTWLSKGAIGLRRWAGLPGELLLPFAKTPANIATRIAEYGPVGFMTELNGLHKLLNSSTPDYALQKKVVEGLGRATLGGAAITVGYLAAKNGNMTGFFPTNPRERNAWEVSGKMEGSIKVGDTWVQVNKLSPLGNLLQVGAAMHDLRGNLETGAIKAAFGSFVSPLRSVAELPMVANVGDIVEGIGKAGTDEAWDSVARIMGRQAQGLVPASGLVRSIAQATDPVIRETKSPSILEATKSNVMAGIPGLSQQLPERMDPLGRTQKRDLGPIGSIFSPLAVRKSLTSDPVRKELERTNAVVTPVKRRKDESQQQFEDRKRMTGTALNRVISSVINSPRYRSISQADPAAARATLEAAGVNSENIPDDRIRARLQGALIEQVMDRAKSAIYRAQPKTFEQRAAQFSKSITRR
jgi:hypothetical protein